MENLLFILSFLFLLRGLMVTSDGELLASTACILCRIFLLLLLIQASPFWICKRMPLFFEALLACMPSSNYVDSDWFLSTFHCVSRRSPWFVYLARQLVAGAPLEPPIRTRQQRPSL